MTAPAYRIDPAAEATPCPDCGKLPTFDFNGLFFSGSCDDCYDYAPDETRRSPSGMGRTLADAVADWNSAVELDTDGLPFCATCRRYHSDDGRCPHCDACPPRSADEPSCCLYVEGVDDLGQWGGEYVPHPEHARWQKANTPRRPIRVPAGQDAETEDADVTF